MVEKIKKNGMPIKEDVVNEDIAGEPTEKQVKFAQAIAKALNKEEELAGVPVEKGAYSEFISTYIKDYQDRPKETKSFEPSEAQKKLAKDIYFKIHQYEKEAVEDYKKAEKTNTKKAYSDFISKWKEKANEYWFKYYGAPPGSDFRVVAQYRNRYYQGKPSRYNPLSIK